MNIKNIISATKNGAIKHSPTILLVMGIGGMLTSMVWAVKETPKALKAIEHEKAKQIPAGSRNEGTLPIKLGAKDTVKAAWKYYIPSAIIFAVSTACLIGGHTVSAKRNAALASVYAVTETALRQYKDAIIENVAPDIQEKIEDTVSQKQIQRAQDPRDVYIQNINPEGILFMEPITGQYFRSDKETIRAAANDIKQDILHDGFSGSATLDDFFDKLHLVVHSDIADKIGWNSSGNCLDDIKFSAQIAANGAPCLVLKYDKAPRYGFDRWDYTS